jgi:hypothetical protein
VSKGDYFKVVSKDKNVVIDVLTDDDVKQIRFNETTSQILESLNKPALWRSSHPVQLAQFMLRTGDTAETLYYDPSIVVLPPVEQFVSKILFNTPNESFMVIDGSKFLEHYVTIVVQPEALPSLKLDNDLVINISNIQEQTIPGTDLKWARIKLDAGKHELFSPDGRFAGVLFGVGRFDSYAMTLGCSLQNPFTEDDKPPTISVVEECGKIAGTITDEISDESYGIYYAFVQTDSTINYKWKIDEIKSDAEFITFTAEPIDKFKDGKFVIDYIDKGGNRNRYTYIYDAINIEYPNEIFLSNMDYNDSVCFEIKLKNKGKRSIDFLSSSVTSDSRIKLYNSLNLPEVFKSDEEIILNLCITPRGDTSGIYGKIYLDFACDVKIEIPFRGTLVALELVVDNIDFGEVQIGNESCDSITVTNLGNAEVLITGSEFNDIFQIDTTEYFPILLQPGESIFLKVCFNPTDRLNYIDSILFSNDYGIELIGTIKGIGVAPDVNSLVYDFGKFRVGSLKNLDREFINSGNQFAEINFDKFSYQSHTNDEISEKLDGIIDLIINPNNIHKLELGLTPIDTLDYYLQALYNTNWDLHPALTVTVNAKGTIPVIQTKNVNFGNIRIFDEVESNETIVLSKGNETLTIDSIIPFSGDFDSFIMDYTQLHNLSILENGELNYLIKFSPKKLGYHELILAVIHDAMPNYLRDTSYISITGNAIQPDSYNVDITIDDNKVESCRFTERKISIKNNGNKIHLTDLILEKSPEEFDAKILNFVPVEIENGETVEFIVRIFTQRDKIGKLKVIAKIFEIDSLVKEFDIIPVSGEIILDEIPEIQYAAGDTIDVTISGKFNANIDTLTSFYLTLNINSDYLLLKNDIFSLKMNNFGDISKYNLNISKTKDKLVFYISEDLINIFDNLNWSVDLRFLGLLSDQISGNWKINVSSDDCFIPAEGNLKTKLDSVCVFDVRHVFIDKNNSHINIYPNPVNDIIRLKTITNIEIYDGKISLTDNLGINYNLAESVFIEKGTGYLEYDVSNLSSGTYILNFESKNLTKNILFVIIR